MGEPPNMRVLVCDDDIAVMMQLAIALEDVELVETSRQMEAENAAASGPLDAAVIDRRLPDGDGLALVRALRKIPAVADIPIVVLTAGHRPEDRVEVLAAGADEYVGKPVDPLVLADLLRRLLATTHDQRHTRRAVQGARAMAGRYEQGWDDLAAVEETLKEPTGRWARRRA